MTSRSIIPAIVALSLGAVGFAQAQGAATTSPTTTTPTTTTPGTTSTPSVAPGTPTRPSAPTSATGTGSTAPAPGATASTTDNNAVNTSPQNNPGAPVAGANSFTEGQARSRIADQGFTAVTDLKLDNQGVWRGKATREGKSVDVAMDYQGNVVAK